jgi:PAS domain-containing protein
MRILPRLNMPKTKAARRLWRKCKARLTLRRIYYSVEIILFIAIYFVVFSGSRLRTLDTFGRRTDAVVSLLLVATFILIHVIARRRLLPKIERYYAPAPYDERKIFFDLSQGSQQVSTIDQLYQQLAERIRDALEASNAAIFVRDEGTGNFNLLVLSTKGRPAETSAIL